MKILIRLMFKFDTNQDWCRNSLPASPLSRPPNEKRGDGCRSMMFLLFRHRRPDVENLQPRINI